MKRLFWPLKVNAATAVFGSQAVLGVATDVLERDVNGAFRELDVGWPVSGNTSGVKRVSELCRAARGWAAGLACIVMAVNAVPAFAGSEGRTSGWSGIYAGAFAGTGRPDNRIVDVDGFADWGNPGSRTGYAGAGAVGGLLVGKRSGIGGGRFRVEADAMFGELSASTNRLDPGCTDEAASSRFRWISTVRVGVEETIGGIGVFVSGGPALARIVNSVTDTDYSGSTCLERDLRLDADDSFRGSSTEVGWAIGAGFEMPLAARWALRVDGSYLDFGSESYRVNLSGNNSCGPGGARTACRYTVRNRLGVVRLGIVYRFGVSVSSVPK